MTPLSACVQAGHDSAYITLESRQPEHWNLKEAPSYWHLLLFSTNRGSMKFLTIQFMFHEVSEPNTTQGILLSAGTQRSPVVRMLCTNSRRPHTNTHMNKHNHVGGLWLDYDWQVSEVPTGMMELTITRYFKVASLSWHTASSPQFWPYAGLLWLKLLHACHIAFGFADPSSDIALLLQSPR